MRELRLGSVAGRYSEKSNSKCRRQRRSHQFSRGDWYDEGDDDIDGGGDDDDEDDFSSRRERPVDFPNGRMEKGGRPFGQRFEPRAFQFSFLIFFSFLKKLILGFQRGAESFGLSTAAAAVEITQRMVYIIQV